MKDPLTTILKVSLAVSAYPTAAHLSLMHSHVAKDEDSHFGERLIQYFLEQ